MNYDDYEPDYSDMEYILMWEEWEASGLVGIVSIFVH